jgi:hypothetical protein
MALIGAAIGIGTSLFGASQQSSAASKANSEAKKAAKEQYKYDKEKYRMGKNKLKADREFTIEGIEIDKRNDKTLADLKDRQSLDRYEFDLKIRQMQMKNSSNQFAKSNQLYGSQLGFNSTAFNTAQAAEQQKMNDAMSQAAFQNEDLYVQGLQQSGTAMARGMAGKSVGKQRQSLNAQLGRNQNIVMQNLLSSRSEMRSNIANIAMQKEGADIQAFANLMIPADAPPEVMEPYATPLPEYQMPRELEDFDFGPEPRKGVVATANTSAPWLNALGSVSSSLVSAFNNGPGFSYSGGGGGLSGASSSGFNLNANFGGFGSSSTSAFGGLGGF